MQQASKGRGRGTPVANAWTVRSEQQTRTTNSDAGKQPANRIQLNQADNGSTRKFEAACAEIQANLKKHVQNMEMDFSDEASSSDDETSAKHDIIASVLNMYGKNATDLLKTEQMIKDSLRSGVASCLICISSIKKNDAIWSCSKCHASLHLSCIQRWGKDSIYFQTEAAADRLPPGQVVDPRKFLWCW